MCLLLLGLLIRTTFGSDVKYPNTVGSWDAGVLGGAVGAPDIRVVGLVDGIDGILVFGVTTFLDVDGVQGGAMILTCAWADAGSVLDMDELISGSSLKEEEAMHGSSFQKQDVQCIGAGNFIATIGGGGARLSGIASTIGSAWAMTAVPRFWRCLGWGPVGKGVRAGCLAVLIWRRRGVPECR